MADYVALFRPPHAEPSCSSVAGYCRSSKDYGDLVQLRGQVVRWPCRSLGDRKQVPKDPFHRVETPTQSLETAKLQEQSREIWGRPARGSAQPSVKAYPGPLLNRRGVEFTTDVEPRGSPNEVRWYWEWTPGVQLRQMNGDDHACIAVTSFKNMQP